MSDTPSFFFTESLKNLDLGLDFVGQKIIFLGNTQIWESRFRVISNLVFSENLVGGHLLFMPEIMEAIDAKILV